MLSIIISTKNRPRELQECITSICKNSFHDYELIIIDQSNNEHSQLIIEGLLEKSIYRYTYIHQKAVGLSSARNTGIRQAKGNMLVFTDDDCIVDRHWLLNINNYYQKNPQISGVFGQTKPYEPSKHKGELCPAVYISNSPHVVRDPFIRHYRDLGNGNNMSFRKEVFSQIGLFNEWLGPGSISGNGADDGEFIFRALSADSMLFFNPKIIIYHNRWLTDAENLQLAKQYNIGDVAFHIFQGIRNVKLRLLIDSMEYLSFETASSFLKGVFLGICMALIYKTPRLSPM